MIDINDASSELSMVLSRVVRINIQFPIVIEIRILHHSDGWVIIHKRRYAVWRVQSVCCYSLACHWLNWQYRCYSVVTGN